MLDQKQLSIARIKDQGFTIRPGDSRRRLAVDGHSRTVALLDFSISPPGILNVDNIIVFEVINRHRGLARALTAQVLTEFDVTGVEGYLVGTNRDTFQEHLEAGKNPVAAVRQRSFYKIFAKLGFPDISDRSILKPRVLKLSLSR